ncbi:hypothetical protein Tco_1536693, partial [Tanacetum coccineum]
AALLLRLYEEFVVVLVFVVLLVEVVVVESHLVFQTCLDLLLEMNNWFLTVLLVQGFSWL